MELRLFMYPPGRAKGHNAAITGDTGRDMDVPEGSDIDSDGDTSGDMPAEPGPLGKRPAARHLVPALVLLFIFYAVSTLAARHSALGLVSASGESVYGRGEYWRLVTALAAHGDIVHLLSNGIVLVFFGWMLTAYFGFMVFPVAALAAGIAINAAVVALNAPGVSVIGCSGMTHCMVALWLVLYLRHDVDSAFPKRVLRVIGFILVMMVPTALPEHVSHLSHLVGFAAGIAAGIIALPLAGVRDPS